MTTEHHQPIAVGRYLLHRKIARGGMATIHIARLLGDVGFSRIVAAKRMHPELAEDEEFVAMFLDEARIASKVHHRNVVNVLDVVTLGDEVMLVQEYVHGVPLSVLLKCAYETKAHVPVPVAAAIASHVLAGLHAAHETVDEMGMPLCIVHRDVSPQNVIIGVDGTARLLDFGVAKAAMSAHVTRKGTFKGKLGYSSPEQIRGEATKQSDIYSLAVVLWEMLVGERLHSHQQDERQLIAEIMAGKLPTITERLADQRSWIGAYRWSQLEAIEPVIRKALDTSARRRWNTAADMEEAIAAVVPIAPPADVAAWLRAVGKDFLEDRERMIAEEEASWRRNGATFALVSGSSPELPVTTTATEPDAELTPQTATLLRRVPTAMIAMLVVMLVGMITFLVRDLDAPPPRGTEPPPSSAASPAAVAPVPLERVPTRNAAPAPEAERDPEPVAERPPDLDLQIEADPDAAAPPAPAPVELPATRNEPPQRIAKPPVARAKPVRQPAPARAASSTPSRAPASSPTPRGTATSTAPPKPAASTPDCSTPFYFEGRKKIFKPGCL